MKQRAAIGQLGKLLTRRSRGKCETCGSDDDVRGYELVPYPEAPDPERSLMACGRCRTWLEGGTPDARDAWFLSEAVWADEPAVRLAAARMLIVLDDVGNPWVRDTFHATAVDAERAEFLT